VCDHRQDDDKYCPSCHISNHWAWREAALKFNLKEPMRFAKDQKYTHFLNIIRHRKPTQEEIDAVFEWSECIVTAAEVRDYVPQQQARG
jgi:hypothetical protein